MEDKNPQKPPRFQVIVEGANELSLGISIVVAILVGVAIGYFLVWISGIKWLFAIGVAWGIGAAILNIYKAYKRTKKSLDELKDNPRYSYKREQNA